MAGDPVFVDTNVIVYLYQAASAFRARARRVIGRLERDGATPWMSRQVLREYLAVVARPIAGRAAPMTGAEAAAAVEGFLTAYAVAEDGPEITTQLLKLLRSTPVGGKQVHDANIVATMRVHGITRPLMAALLGGGYQAAQASATARAGTPPKRSGPAALGGRPGSVSGVCAAQHFAAFIANCRLPCAPSCSWSAFCARPTVAPSCS